MDSLNLFPYVRAALIGHATRSEMKDPYVTRRGGTTSCQRMYRECPTKSEDLLDYMNNHNGGLINQVQPSVNDEVGPILSAIVSDTFGTGGTSGSTSSNSGSSNNALLNSVLGGGSSQSSSASSDNSIFGVADSVITNALLQGATSYLTNGGGSSSSSGALGSGTSSSSGFGSSLFSSLSSLLGKKKK